jgi:hypothetical protein
VPLSSLLSSRLSHSKSIHCVRVAWERCSIFPRYSVAIATFPASLLVRYEQRQ